MRIHLIMATVGRTAEAQRFLDALDEQTYREFELVVVDQSPDDRIARILEPYERSFPIRRVESARRGASHGRNQGLAHADGDIVAFPDDDCWYPPDVLARVASFFSAHDEWDVLAGRSVDEAGRPSVARWDTQPGRITKYNVWRRAVEFTMFLRRPVLERVGGFDESLGPGCPTPYQCGEGTDLLLRALEARFSLYYDPELLVRHPDPVSGFRPPTLARGYEYGKGMGRVLRDHEYPWWYASYSFLRPLGGSLVSSLAGRPGKARYHWNIFLGRVSGWRR